MGAHRNPRITNLDRCILKCPMGIAAQAWAVGITRDYLIGLIRGTADGGPTLKLAERMAELYRPWVPTAKAIGIVKFCSDRQRAWKIQRAIAQERKALAAERASTETAKEPASAAP